MTRSRVLNFRARNALRFFNSKNGVCTHLFRVQGARRVVRNFVSSFQCPVCQTEHGTRLRCMHHCQATVLQPMMT